VRATLPDEFILRMSPRGGRQVALASLLRRGPGKPPGFSATEKRQATRWRGADRGWTV
jgi:hypothetical protein